MPTVVPTAAAAYAVPAPVAQLQPRRMHLLGAIGIVVVILLAVLYTVAAPVPPLPNAEQTVGFRAGRLIAVLLLPWLVAYPVAGRRKARNPNLFAGLFCGIALFLLIANIAGSLPEGSFTPESTDQKISRLMREAAGLQGVRKSFFPESKTDTKLRELFKQIIVINKDYQAALDKLDLSSVSKLNTPESFRDPDSVGDALRQLRAAYDLDARQEQRMRQVLDDFRRGFDDLSSSDRDSMLKGFNDGLQKTMPIRERAVSSEKAWVDSLDDVYSYARYHHSQFELSGGQLLISDEGVRQQFNTRIHTMNATRQEFLQAKSDFDHLQSQTLQKTGITRDQTGLH